MQEIQLALAGLKLGAPQAFRNLAVFPLAAPGDAPAGYLLLDEALERRCARVTEVSREGSVPDLAFENDSAEKILLVDGDELVGAKQNRVVNLSILVGGGSRIVIPVSCVEQGRWSWRSRDFSSGGRTLFASADSPGEYVAAFRAEPRQCGAVLAIDGKVAGLELFDSGAAFRRYFGKLVRGYAMDALETANGKTLAPPEAEVRRFLERVVGAAGERFAAIGEGEDIRLSGEGLAGGALAAGGRVVHLAAHGVG